MAGYTGWGVWLVAGVLAFNLAYIPAWFLVNHLRRNHEFQIKKARTFLELLRRERGKSKGWRTDSELDTSVALIEEQVSEAEGRGPLWGRRQVTLAQLSVMQLSARWPELADAVHLAMDRRASPLE